MAFIEQTYNYAPKQIEEFLIGSLLDGLLPEIDESLIQHDKSLEIEERKVQCDKPQQLDQKLGQNHELLQTNQNEVQHGKSKQLDEKTEQHQELLQSNEKEVIHNKIEELDETPEQHHQLPQTNEEEVKYFESEKLDENAEECHESPESDENQTQEIKLSAQIGFEDSTKIIRLREELDLYRERNTELLKRFFTLSKRLEREEIASFEGLEKRDPEAKKILVNLAQETKSVSLGDINIGLFGLTSTGKSTILNSIIGQKVADTGVRETTTKLTPYSVPKYTLWEAPGRNDEISYLSMEYISFFKGLSRRLIVIQKSVKENSSIMKLLDEIGLHYDIVFNKFDKFKSEEQEVVKNKIKSEMQIIGLKGVEHTYFVSAQNPKMFDDWLTMVNALTS